MIKNKKIKKKMFIVNHGTFAFDILVCVGGVEDKEIFEYLKNKCKYTPDAEEKEKLHMNGQGRTIMFKNGATVLQIGRARYNAAFHDTLAHEIFHAVEFLFDKVGIPHNIEVSSESFAYQIGYVTGFIYEKLLDTK